MQYCIRLHIAKGPDLRTRPCLSFWKHDYELLASCISCALASVAIKNVLAEIRPCIIYVLDFVCNDGATKLC